MRKISILCFALLTSVSSFASSGDYTFSGFVDELRVFAIFLLIVMIVYMVLSIVFIVRWWNMTTDVKEINERLRNSDANCSLTFQIATGNMEQANKDALVMLVGRLMRIYNDEYYDNKADTMNKYLAPILSKMEKLGITLPEYVMTGENFIDYINGLTGNAVPYHE